MARATLLSTVVSLSVCLLFACPIFACRGGDTQNSAASGADGSNETNEAPGGPITVASRAAPSAPAVATNQHAEREPAESTLAVAPTRREGGVSDLTTPFRESIDHALPIESWLAIAELALSSLADSTPVASPNGGWTYRVEWPDESVESRLTLVRVDASDVDVFELRFDLEDGFALDAGPRTAPGVLQIFLRWQGEALIECTVIAQAELPAGEELDRWIASASTEPGGARRKGAFVQCYSDKPAQRRTLEIRVEETAEGVVRESRFGALEACDCDLGGAEIDSLRNLCRSLRQRG